MAYYHTHHRSYEASEFNRYFCCTELVLKYGRLVCPSCKSSQNKVPIAGIRHDSCAICQRPRIAGSECSFGLLGRRGA